MERIKGERIELQSDGAEKHDQNRLKLGRFDVEKNALGRSSKLCFLCRRGAHFQKNREQSCRKLKNAAERPKMTSVMGICAGLAGPKTENVDLSLVLVGFIEGSKAGRERMSLSDPAVWGSIWAVSTSKK